MRVAVAALAALVLGAGAAGAAGSSASRTHVVTGVTPFTSAGLLRAGLHVAAEKRGTCIPGSDALVTDVYRCGSGDGIYDPCWREYRARGVAVVCLLAPWDTRVFRLRLSRDPGPSPRPTAAELRRASPWGIELAAGVRCLELQGAHATVDGTGNGAVIDYGCTNGVSLLRGVDRSGPLWRARAVRCRTNPPCARLGMLPVTTVWFGGNDPLRRG